MGFSRALEERRQRREAARRNRALERRQEADLRDAEDERRREAAVDEARTLEAELEADRERRVAVTLQARAKRMAERRGIAQRVEQRQRVIESIIRSRRDAADAEEAKRVQRGQLVDSIRDEKAEAEREDQRRSAAREKADARPLPPKPGEETAEPERARDASESSAAEKVQDAGKVPPADDSAARTRTRDDQRARAEREARNAERLETRRREREAADADVARQRARRLEARDARLAERQEANQSLEAIRSERDAAQRARLEQRQAHDAASAARRERLQTARALRTEAQRDSARAEQAALERGAVARRGADARPERPSRPEPSAPSAPSDPLTDRIPSGVLSGSLPWLTTEGNRVITIAGEPVVLRGVNLVGLDGAAPDPVRGYAAGAGITDALLDRAIEWGANVVRVAINRRRVLTGTDRWTGWDYLHELDDLVRRLSGAGAYTLLSLRRLDDSTVFGTRMEAGRVVPNEIAPQPDFDAIGMWRLVAERYADEPAVLFDLYTAPRPPAADDLTGFRTDWDLWTLWVQMTVADLRQVHPRALCLVAGLDDGSDFSGLPIPGSAGDPIPNLVYAAHLTPRRSAHWPAIRALARRHPVFVTEWGGADGDVTWGERTALTLRAEGLGWTAAHWNAEPPLVSTVHDRLVPTRFGHVVQRSLALAAADARPSTMPGAPLSFAEGRYGSRPQPA